jgi:hypothetical protein
VQLGRNESKEVRLLLEIRDILLRLLALLSPEATTAVLSTKGTTMTTTTAAPLFNLSATVANASGAPLLDNDGVTPFVQPSPIPVAADQTEAVATFTDSNGVTIAPPTGDGSGIVVTFASDNPAVTIGTAVGSGFTATAPITAAPVDQATTAVLSTE